MILLSGYNPIVIFGALFKGSFGSAKSIVSGLRWMTPLLFTGVAAAIAFSGGMFNFGIEGQLYAGGLSATIVALVSPNMPGYILIPLMMTVSMLAGAIWAIIPAIVRVKLGGSEIVPALMMNYLAIHLTDYIVHYFFMAGGVQGESVKTERIPGQALLSNIVEPYKLTYGLVIGLAVVVLFWLIMKKFRLGYDIYMSGLNPEFANYGGINVNGVRITVMLISGAIAGLGGAIEIMAVRWRFESRFSPGFGDDGILAALLGSSTPIGTLVGSFFMGFLKAGSLAVERYTEVSRAFITIIKGTIISFVSARMLSEYIGMDKVIEKIKSLISSVREKNVKEVMK